jgi:glucose/arabinose dehydrogenase
MSLTRFPLLTSALLALAATAQQTPLTVQVEMLPPTGLTRIVDIVHCGDERLFLVLKAGRIVIMNPDNTVLPTPFLNITTQVNSSGNEQGLLGMAFDPDYAQNGYFYVNYINGSGSGTTRVSRFSVSADPNIANAASEEILWTAAQPYTNHNGGDIDFGPDGMLYIAMGDGGSGGDPQGYAQNMNSPLGKVLRIDVSGASGYTVPPDNPFVGQPNMLPEIWASGLRNPWRMGFDRQTGDFWTGDVGQNAVEEVDFWPAGDNSGPNFGWRCYEGNNAYNTSGCQSQASYVAPAAAHPQSSQGWCSVIGGRVYRGPAYWRLGGRYLYTDYCGGQIYSLLPNGMGAFTRTQVLATGTVGFSCIGENAAGEIFLGNDNAGRLYRLKEVCTALPPTLVVSSSEISSSDALAYQWYLNGASLAGATNQSVTPVLSGFYHVISTVNTGCQLSSDTVWFSPLGVEDIGRDGRGLVARPNPAHEELVIDGPLAIGGRLEVIDAAGRVFITQRVGANGPQRLATGALAEGAYLVRALAADGTLIGQLPVMVAH